jgi:hypothetical protein
VVGVEPVLLLIGHDADVTTIAKFQTCPEDGERVPTQFEVKGDEIEYPGIHVCSRGHAFRTRPDPRPGESTIDTGDVQKVD